MLPRHFLPGILACFFLLAEVQPISAQVRPGIKFGLSTPDVDPVPFIATDPRGEDVYGVSIEKAKYGVHAGVFIQVQVGGFFLQPELLYNSRSIAYQVDLLQMPEAVPDEFRDTYQSLDFPILIGLKVGAVRLGGGPVGHIFIDSESGFDKYESFQPLFEELTWGWQAGLGLDFWKLHFDFRYEGNLNTLGDHISFYGQQYDFSTKNNRLVASFGFSF